MTDMPVYYVIPMYVISPLFFELQRYSMAISTTSNINIQLLMNQQAQNNNHRTEIIVNPPAPSDHTLQRTMSNRSTSSEPIIWKYEPKIFNRSTSENSSKVSSGPPSPNSPTTLTKPPMFSKLTMTESEGDHDSVLMSSSLDDSQDSRSLMSYSSGGVDSACSMDGDRDSLGHERTAITSEGSCVIMLLMSCESESTVENSKFIDLTAGVANACLQYFKKKETDKVGIVSLIYKSA